MLSHRRSLLLARFMVLSGAIAVSSAAAGSDPLPFTDRVEVYRSEEGDIAVFRLRLEQTFLAEEFVKSNDLRLTALDENAHLIYPQTTRFEQKHAEFYGRLKREGTTKLRLAYEIVSENLDGSRKVDVLTRDYEVPIPAEPVGPASLYKDWAGQQNRHFADLLRYYPDESFFEYVLLQSKQRYGVEPPALPAPARDADRDDIEVSLYHTFSGGLAIQQSLQRQALGGAPTAGDLDVHISRLQPSRLRSLDYEELLKKRIDEDGIAAKPHEIARLVPRDQYFLHFRSMSAANELMDLSVRWGHSVLRMLTVSARDHHLREKYEDQLCIRRDPLSQLFADQVIDELAVTGSDFFIAEGTDLTLVFKLRKPDVFRRRAAGWLEEVKEKYPDVTEIEINYKGRQLAARYRRDRLVSSFVVYHDDYAIFSNSHRAVRRIIDVINGSEPNLYDALDYRYVTTLLPPGDDANSAYLYGSEAFLKRLVSPAFKIAEKRRLEAFNNLVILNNASLFYRLEHGDSPQSLSDLVEGDFVNPRAIVDPTGGAYAFDPEYDTCTSTLYNRIKYLTPIIELVDEEAMKVSRREQDEYSRYKERYEAFWRGFFDPIAVRMTLGGPTVKLESAVLPFANGSLYANLRELLDKQPQPLGAAGIAKSAVASVQFVPGRDKVAALLQTIPGVSETLEADPTLTDLSWLGDRASLHLCDGDTIVEFDPTRLQPLQAFIPLSVGQQALAGGLVAATSLPVYVTLDVEEPAKARRLLDDLTSRIFLKGGEIGLPGLHTHYDAYRLPDYRGHAVYVVSFQLYAAKVRLYTSIVGGKLVAATKPQTLHEVIDASAEPPAGAPPEAHAQLRLNFRALDRLKDDLSIYWSEKARRASHRNVMPIYTLLKLYDVPIEEVNRLSDAKYGVTYFCPGGGEYVYDAAHDQVLSTVYGNRRRARQELMLSQESPFAKFFDSLEEITATLRFTDEGLLATVEIVRKTE